MDNPLSGKRRRAAKLLRLAHEVARQRRENSPDGTESESELTAAEIAALHSFVAFVASKNSVSAVDIINAIRVNTDGTWNVRRAKTRWIVQGGTEFLSPFGGVVSGLLAKAILAPFGENLVAFPVAGSGIKFVGTALPVLGAISGILVAHYLGKMRDGKNHGAGVVCVIANDPVRSSKILETVEMSGLERDAAFEDLYVTVDAAYLRRVRMIICNTLGVTLGAAFGGSPTLAADVSALLASIMVSPTLETGGRVIGKIANSSGTTLMRTAIDLAGATTQLGAEIVNKVAKSIASK